MQFTDIGYEWNPPLAGEAPVESDKNKRVDYPTIYIRSKDELPDMQPDADGYVYFMAKARIAGFSEKTEGDKMLELEVQAICPCDQPEGMDMGKPDTPKYDDLGTVLEKMKSKKMADMADAEDAAEGD